MGDRHSCPLSIDRTRLKYFVQMKKNLLLLTAVLLVLSSCCSQQYSGIATGSSLGGMFGSSIGGLFGGPRGHDAGALIGMVAGGAMGAAATSPRTDGRDGNRTNYNGVEYGNYVPSTHPGNAGRGWQALQISSIRFNDLNNNRCLDAGERARIVMDIYNNGQTTLYDIAPQITCSNKRVNISPTAVVSVLEPGQGFRYTAEVVGLRNLKNGQATFCISFGSGKQKVTLKSFTIATSR